MKQQFLTEKIKNINNIFNIIIIIVFTISIIINIYKLHLNIQRKLEQQADLCILNINKINNNSDFLITYLLNLISINDNYNNKYKMQRILNSITNTQSIKSVVVWIDNEDRLFHNKNSINTHHIANLENIIPIKELVTNAYQHQINPYIIDDIRFYHEKIFSIVTYLQKNKKPIGYLMIGFSLSNLLNKINLVPNKYNISIALLDIKQKVHTVNLRDTIPYDEYNKKFYKQLKLLRYIDNSPFIFIVNYDKKIYLIKIITIMTYNVIALISIYILIRIYAKLLIEKIIEPIKNIASYINENENLSINCKIYEINLIKNYLINNAQYNKLSIKLENELQNYKEQLNYNCKIKSEFTSRVSHEIKTPLNIIILYSEIIKNAMFGKIENKKYQDYASYIYNSGQSLMLMLEDLLLLNKIENNKIDFNQIIDIDIKKMLYEILNELKNYINSKNAKIQTNIADNLPHLLLDYPKTKRALYHIIHNAIKFNKDKNGITDIKCQIKKINYTNHIEIIIINRGITINAKKIEHITLPFYQSDSGIDRKFDGLGIGLTIAKKFIEMQGGKLIIKSDESSTTVIINFTVN